MPATHNITEMWFDESKHRVEVLLEAIDTSKFPRLLVILAPQYPDVQDELAISRRPLIPQNKYYQ